MEGIQSLEALKINARNNESGSLVPGPALPHEKTPVALKVGAEIFFALVVAAVISASLKKS